jgi:hypothetical protein
VDWNFQFYYTAKSQLNLTCGFISSAVYLSVDIWMFNFLLGNYFEHLRCLWEDVGAVSLHHPSVKSFFFLLYRLANYKLLLLKSKSNIKTFTKPVQKEPPSLFANGVNTDLSFPLYFFFLSLNDMILGIPLLGYVHLAFLICASVAPSTFFVTY